MSDLRKAAEEALNILTASSGILNVDADVLEQVLNDLSEALDEPVQEPAFYANKELTDAVPSNMRQSIFTKMHSPVPLYTRPSNVCRLDDEGITEAYEHAASQTLRSQDKYIVIKVSNAIMDACGIPQEGEQ